MKKYLVIVVVLVAGVAFLNFSEKPEIEESLTTSEVNIPDDVQSVIENSCYGCHNSDSKNTKGKGKIKFDELGSYKTHKLVGKLGGVAEVVESGDMPPKKFLSKYPEAALTDEQKTLLINWAESTAKSYSE